MIVKSTKDVYIDVVDISSLHLYSACMRAVHAEFQMTSKRTYLRLKIGQKRPKC